VEEVENHEEGVVLIMEDEGMIDASLHSIANTPIVD
jgi:hypothetical protein